MRLHAFFSAPAHDAGRASSTLCRFGLTLIAAALLSACGGGGGGGASGGSVSTPPPATTLPEGGGGSSSPAPTPTPTPTSTPTPTPAPSPAPTPTPAPAPSPSPCNAPANTSLLSVSLRVIAGSETMPGDSDGTGKAARFNQPEAITRDAEGNLYVADNGNAKIKKVCPGAQVSTVANVAALSPFAVKGLAVDGKGSVYFSNLQGVHKLVSATQIAPVGSGIGSLGRLAIDSKGDVYTFENLYLSNIPDESVGQSPAGLRRITATQTEHVWDYRMSSPQGTTNNEDGFTDIVLDEATKNLYISSDRFNVVAKLSYEGNYAGTHDTVPGITLPGTQRIQRLATDTQGRIYAFTNVLGKIYQIMPDGSVSAVAGTGTSLSIPSAGAVTIRSIVGTGPKTFAFTAGHAVYEIKLP